MDCIAQPMPHLSMLRMHSTVGTPCKVVTRLKWEGMAQRSRHAVSCRHAGIDRSYTWPPWSGMFDESQTKHNGTPVGILSAGPTAIATYLLMRRGMLRSIKKMPSTRQPKKIDNIAQLAKSLAPG